MALGTTPSNLANEGASCMQIPVVAGVGHGSTLLSAFDDALRVCGVLNYNLIPLSSVIPPAPTVQPIDRYHSSWDEHGHRLYVVKAEVRSDQPGHSLGAGIGWYQWHDGRGVFVEHELAGKNKQDVTETLRTSIQSSIADLCAARDVPFDPPRMHSRICVAGVDDRPTSALVLAIFQAQAWA
jgi:arginine decarboxylase